MDAGGYARCTPRKRDDSIAEQPAIDFSSGYIQRAKDVLPKQGSKRPWRLHQNYALDMLEFRFASVDDGTMEFKRAEKRRSGVKREAYGEEIAEQRMRPR
jgi:hypothetical protein